MAQSRTRLYHVSDQPGIVLFEPRPSPRNPQEAPVVWAVDEGHLPNYLFPRECPRVTFSAPAGSDPADVVLLAGTSAGRVAAIESAWLARVREERLYRYELASDGFVLQDETAGYYVSARAVEPIAEVAIDDVLGELLRHDVELRVMPSLWKLREAVIGSTLAFSIIRMRNAQPPVEGYQAWYPLA